MGAIAITNTRASTRRNTLFEIPALFLIPHLLKSQGALSTAFDVMHPW